jgi:polygalacturonase
MKKSNQEVQVNQNKENPTPLSRRKWLERVSVPTLATIGASMIGTRVLAAPQDRSYAIDEKMRGAGVYNIREFGAKGDGKTLDSKAVQAAIDACHQDKGGTVLVPAGDFVIGTIELKSNVTLHISTQGKLLGSPRREDYQAGNGVPPGNGNVVMLYAANAENICIEGRGTIDGNGGAFYTGQGDNTGPNSTTRGYMDRPHLFIFYKVTNLLLRDAFFTKSAYHCFRILHCKKVNIDGVRIYNRINKNNDGFH